MGRFYTYLILFFIIFNGYSYGQTTVRITNRTQELIFDSEHLNEKRKVLIQLPESYFDSPQGYPSIYVLNAEYLYDPVVGFVHYYSYLDSMPEAIVIGIAHENENQDLIENKDAFRKFILKELIPHVNESYKPTNFKTIIGNDKSANFLASFIDSDTSYFNAFIGMSPSYSKEILAHLDTIFPVIDTSMVNDSLSINLASTRSEERFYFCTGTDLKSKLLSQTKLKNLLTKKAPNYFKWKYKVDKSKNIATLPIMSIPDGISFAFQGYREMDGEKWAKITSGEIDGLTEIQLHYKKTERLLGVPVNINMNELLKLSDLYFTQKKFELLVELGDFAMDAFPETGESFFIAGKGQEGMKNYREALNYYEMGKAKFNVPTTNKQDLENQIARLKYMMANTENN